MTTQRAVIYLRQSTYREESISLEVQEATCRAYCKRLGYTVMGVEADPGISGRTWQRAGVQNVMAALESKQADVVVLWRWSRLSRSRRDWALAADRADLAGARIESATEPNDATAAGRFARGVMTELAAFESERIGESWKEAHARRVAAGLPANGKARFGYTYDRDQQVHVPDPVTGPVLADAYRRYVAGQSVYQLTRWLNQLGHAPAAGYGKQVGVWSDRTVRRMLDSGFGAGFITVAGEKHAGAHEPVVGADVWTQYWESRLNRSRPSGEGRREYVLTGLCWCECGARMACQMESGGRPRLRCRAVKNSGAHRGGYASYDRVLRLVLAEVEARGVEGAVGDIVGERPAPQRDFVAEEDALAQQLLNATRQHVAGVIPEDAYVMVRDELTVALEQLRVERAGAEAEAARPTVRVQCRSLIADWERLPVEAKREALRVLIERVTIVPGSPGCEVNITWRGL